ncbi:hypothetical protein QOT17_011507 [Balamuthia mandrillaris]
MPLAGRRVNNGQTTYDFDTSPPHVFTAKNLPLQQQLRPFHTQRLPRLLCFLFLLFGLSYFAFRMISPEDTSLLVLQHPFTGPWDMSSCASFPRPEQKVAEPWPVEVWQRLWLNNTLEEGTKEALKYVIERNRYLLPELSVVLRDERSGKLHQPTFAYGTMFFSSSHVAPARQLARSLMASGSPYPLFMMVPAELGPQVAPLLLQEPNVVVLGLLKEFQHFNKNFKFQRCWNKLLWFQMAKFERIIHVDTDVVVRHNIDHLFTNLDALVSVGQAGEGKEADQAFPLFAMAHDSAKADHPAPGSFGHAQAGVLLLSPCCSLFHQMASLSENNVALTFPYHYAEQQFFQWYFSWLAISLPTRYNAIPFGDLKGSTVIRDALVVHYAGAKKPWEYDPIVATEDWTPDFWPTAAEEKEHA